jgi:hypothetical protein
MNKRIISKIAIKISLILTPFLIVSDGLAAGPKELLNELYEHVCQHPSDINLHLPELKRLASECSSVVEIGMRGMVSSWGILEGLSENKATHRSYLGIDMTAPRPETLGWARRLAEANGISFTFWMKNDFDVEIPRTEMLFIDSLHTYCHLTYELEKFSPYVEKYIAMHDTSEPWGYSDDTEYKGNYSEYPYWQDREKRGLWPAVEDFLERHPEWSLEKRDEQCHGLTTLKRLKDL